MIGRRSAVASLAGSTAALLSAALWLALSGGRLPGEHPPGDPRPGSPPPPPVVVASLPFWNLSDGTSVVLANGADFTEVSPWVYGISPSGQVVSQVPPDQAAAARSDLARLRASGTPLLPTIANAVGGDFAYEPVARILHDPDLVRRHVADIADLARQEGYAGIDIDYEDLHADDRQAFTSFLQALGATLHAEHKLLSVALFAKTTDAGYDQRNVAQDYAAIGRVADEVRLMAYDYHWPESGPGPVGPVGWVRDVLRYAVTQIPPEKIILGVPLSGYDWVDGHGTPVTWLQCLHLSRTFHAPVRYDTTAQSPWLRYVDSTGRQHEVWFENAESMTAKLDAVRGTGICGVYLWMFGGEDGRVWPVLHTELPVSGASKADGSATR